MTTSESYLQCDRLVPMCGGAEPAGRRDTIPYNPKATGVIRFGFGPLSNDTLRRRASFGGGGHRVGAFIVV